MLILSSEPEGTELMDELIKTVVEKAGISESQAKTAIDVVVGQLKGRLPEPIAGQLESMLGGDDGGDGDGGGLLDSAKGMLGR
jgi:hypothetical protein